MQVINHAIMRATLSVSVATGLTFPATNPAAAQRRSIDVAAMPLERALDEISRQSNHKVDFDPDAVPGKMSAPVVGKATAYDAVVAALRGTGLTVTRDATGELTVTNDVVVTAQRDEAETNLLVKQASSSNRIGQSLRELARNETVISAKLMADQQSQNIIDVLKNAGGVTVVTSPQGGNNYFIRGFGSSGIVNGLAGDTQGRFGASQAVANLERVEILKGPDAILAGTDNLGGVVNLVTKKPSANPILNLALETGSFGAAKVTIDASNALNDSKTLSARFVAEAATASRNDAGYRGDQEYLFAPSIRFKNANSDFIAGVSATRNVYGKTPFSLIGGNPYRIVVEPEQPIGTKNQGIALTTTNYYVDLNQKVADWLTLVARGQYQEQSATLSQYTLGSFTTRVETSPTFGTKNYSGDINVLTNPTKSVDGFARIKFAAAGISNKLVVGSSFQDNRSDSRTSLARVSGRFNVFTPSPVLLPLPVTADSFRFEIRARQYGYYVQDLIEFWKLHVSLGYRHNIYRSKIRFGTAPFGDDPQDRSGVPSAGVVLDVTGNVSLFGNYVEGFSPSFSLQRDGSVLPSTRTKNVEAGVKASMFDDRVELVASAYRLRQSNRLIADPIDPDFSIGAPGIQTQGIDIDLRGQPLRGWDIQSSFTYNETKLLVPDPLTPFIVAAPKVTYSVYTAYRQGFGDGLEAGASVGLFGQSKSYGDSDGGFIVPASRSVDANLFLKYRRFGLNLGVKNVFDRRNYGVTYFPTTLPRADGRTWRLTATYSFF